MTWLFHVPKPPLNYLPRPDQLEPLVELLLSAFFASTDPASVGSKRTWFRCSSPQSLPRRRGGRWRQELS